MGVRAGHYIEAALHGMPWRDLIQVSVVADAQRANEQRFDCTAATLTKALEAHNVTNGAVIFLRLPKTACAEHVVPLQAAE